MDIGKKISRILVDLDPSSDEQPALDKAIFLAKKLDASIELLVVDYDASITVNWFFDEQKAEEAKNAFLKSRLRWIDSYVSKVVDANISVKTDVRWHKPIYEGIIRKAIDSKADLIVKSTHRHPKVNKWFFTPNDWQLLKSSRIPVLLAKQSTSLSYSQLMAAIDPTQSHGKREGLDKNILDMTFSLSDTILANVHIAHCYQPVGLELWENVGVKLKGMETVSFEYDDYLNRLHEKHKYNFDSIVKDYSCDEKNQHVTFGSPEEQLPELIKDNDIDLLVMGTAYRTGLLGSTAEKILDEVDCDILAIK